MSPPTAPIPPAPPSAPSWPALAALGLDRATVWHGLRLALAAWLAFCAATALGLPNAFWAAMPVWVVAQNTRGLLIERGLWRLVGTMVGAAAGFALLATLPHTPLLLAALTLWVGLCAAGTHLIRGVLSYGAMLAGMTAAVVILPALLMPEHATALALSRVACTLIGVVTVTGVTGLFTPSAPRAAFQDELARTAHNIARLDAPPSPAREAEQLAALTRLDASLPLMLAGTLLHGPRLRARVETVLQAALAALAAWHVLALRPCGTAHERPHGRDDHDGDHGSDPVRQQLRQANALLLDTRRILQPTPITDEVDARRPAPLPLYRDWTRARQAGLLAGAATLAAAALGLLWPGPEGELAALGVCIFSMVLGSLPMPHLVAPKMLAGICVGVALATAYRFLVQPHASGGWLPLAATLAPFLIVGGLARASRRTWIALPALDANMCFMLASQAGMPPAGAAAIVHGSLALALAAGAVTLGALVAQDRPLRHALEARARLRSAWRALLATPAGS
ncbi:MAG: FUSC family protein, partial [Comamonas sp.]